MLCPRALLVLRRQLALRARLQHEGRIHHDHLFFKDNGEPIRNLLYPYVRWRQTLQRLRMIRYRKPYCARQSVSWNLMTGKSPLWVAKQHGHTITTMLKAYAAWTEGATPSDIQAITRAMAPDEAASARLEIRNRTAADAPGKESHSIAPETCTRAAPGAEAASPSFATGFATRHRVARAKCSKRRGITGGERGIRTLEGLLTLTPLAGQGRTTMQHNLDAILHYLTAFCFVLQFVLRSTPGCPNGRPHLFFPSHPQDPGLQHRSDCQALGHEQVRVCASCDGRIRGALDARAHCRALTPAGRSQRFGRAVHGGQHLGWP